MQSGPFGCLTKLNTKRSELVQKFVPRSHLGIVRDKCTRSPHWTINSCFGVFHTILVHLGPFGCFTNLGAKRCCVGILHNKRTRSTPLDPKIMFCCISYHLGAFGTVWLPYKSRCKTGRTSAKLRAMKSHRNFSQRTHSIHPIGP